MDKYDENVEYADTFKAWWKHGSKPTLAKDIFGRYLEDI